MTARPTEGMIISRFAFHMPDLAGRLAMSEVRVHVRTLALAIHRLCPESREKSTALTNLATVMMNANSAIVQQYPIDESDLLDSEKELVKCL